MSSKRKPLESAVENHVVAYAKSQGCLVRKMNGMGFRGWPDRMFITRNGKHFYIEFKRPGSGHLLSAGQFAMLDNLRQRGVPCHVCDDKADGIELIDRETGQYPVGA